MRSRCCRTLERHPLVHVAEHRRRTHRDGNGISHGGDCWQELAFPLPAVSGALKDFGTDGGAHDFLRAWKRGATTRSDTVDRSSASTRAGRPRRLQERRLLSANNRNVFSVADRLFTFDIDFLEAPLLPPGTPSFRDVNTLTFRQLLRPTQ
jgi:hypothetical protein